MITRSAAGARRPVDPAIQTYPALALASINTSYRLCGFDSLYLYLDSGGGQLRRMNAAGTIETIKNFAGQYIQRVFATHTPGRVLAMVQTGTSGSAVFGLYVSTDYGSTFDGTPVLLLGDANGPGGTQTANVSLMSRGLCKAVIGGVNCLLLGEYNVNGSRVAGGDNDRVRIMKSTNDGATWSVVTNYNVGGTNVTRHCHGIWQHPADGSIYLAFGDLDAEVAIVRWDGTTTWADNIPWATLATTPQFRVVTGKQRYRTCDLLFEADGLVIAADSATNGEAGIWRCNHNLSNYRRVNSQIDDVDHLLMCAAASPSHNYVIGGLYATATNRYLHIFSAEPRGPWKLVGKITMRAGTSADLPWEACWWNGTLVLGSLWVGSVSRATIWLAEAGETDGATPTLYY